MPQTARLHLVTAEKVSPALWTRRHSRKIRESVEPRRATILWIDDYLPGLAVYSAVFENLGFRVITASSGLDGLEILATSAVDVVVTDYEMPEMNGEQVVKAAKRISPATPVVLFSGSTGLPERVRQLADACCDKAGSREQLLGVLHNLLQHKRSSSLQPPLAALASDHGQRTVA